MGLKGLIPDGMLVRVSSIDSNRARGYEQQASFLEDLVAAVPPAGRDRIFGTLKSK
jgi:hypothetical protein